MPMDNRLMIPRRNYDADALRYLNAVQLADGQALEPEIQSAVDAFVRGCKADGLWDAIKASCILCGARTISGALVPLAGTAPTAYNFTSANYNRETGLVGVPASSTHIDTNRANDADGQNDRHLAVYATTLQTTSGLYIDGYPSGSSQSYLRGQGTQLTAPVNGNYLALGNAHAASGFLGASRFSSTLQRIRGSGLEQQLSSGSSAPPSRSVYVFGPTVYSDARLAFYSIGSSLSLSSLDARVTTLVSEIAAAIP